MNGSQEIEKAQILHNSMEFCKICVLSTVKNPAETKFSAGYNIRHNDRGWEIITFSYRCGAASQPCVPVGCLFLLRLYGSRLRELSREFLCAGYL